MLNFIPTRVKVGLAAVALTAAAAIGGYVSDDALQNDPAGVPDGFTYVVDSYGGLTYEEALQMRSLGVTVYVQALSALPPRGLVQPQDRVNSLRNAYDAGLGIAGYVLTGCDVGGSGYSDYEFARAGIPDDLWDALLFTAIDIELTCQGDYNRILEALSASEYYNKHRIIYTNWNGWNQIGNPPKPEGTLLWNAWWDDQPDIDFSKKPFGGWTEDEVIGEQWQGGSYPAGCAFNCELTLVAGHNVDRNVFRYEQTLPPVITPPDCICGESYGDPAQWGEVDPTNCYRWNHWFWRWVAPGSSWYDPFTNEHSGHIGC